MTRLLSTLLDPRDVCSERGLNMRPSDLTDALPTDLSQLSMNQLGIDYEVASI